MKLKLLLPLIFLVGCTTTREPGTIVPIAVDVIQTNTFHACDNEEHLTGERLARCTELKIRSREIDECTSAWLEAWSE